MDSDSDGSFSGFGSGGSESDMPSTLNRNFDEMSDPSSVHSSDLDASINSVDDDNNDTVQPGKNH